MYDDRKKQFEKKFELDEEKKFKATALRNRMLGKWAGELLGISEADIDKYINDVVLSDFEKPGDEDVVEKIKNDFEKESINLSKEEIRKKIRHFFDLALKELDEK